jgi:hypothetical protein
MWLLLLLVLLSVLHVQGAWDSSYPCESPGPLVDDEENVTLYEEFVRVMHLGYTPYTFDLLVKSLLKVVDRDSVGELSKVEKHAILGHFNHRHENAIYLFFGEKDDIEAKFEYRRVLFWLIKNQQPIFVRLSHEKPSPLEKLILWGPCREFLSQVQLAYHVEFKKKNDGYIEVFRIGAGGCINLVDRFKGDLDWCLSNNHA